MTRVILRGFFARKLRSVLTGLAIVIGVMLMAGTYILTDTINSAFGSIFSTANRNNAVVITPHQALGRNTQIQTSPITTATLRRVRAVPGVAQAAGTVFSPVTFLTAANKRLNTNAPGFIAGEIPKPFESFSPVSGAFPTKSDQVALDQATAQRASLKIGDSMKVAGATQARLYRIVGIVKFAGSQSFGGAGAAVVTPQEAQRVIGQPGRYNGIDVAAQPGVTPDTLRDRIRSVLPGKFDVRTGAQQAVKETSDVKAALSPLRTFLLIFAYVALFVGAFIIFNTFSITVAQRTREFGLLRTLGATPAQITRSVAGEALLLGLLGSLIGLVAGLAVAPGLDQLFKSVGADLPTGGTVLNSRTIIVSLALGTGITLIAGVIPARRASRVPPVAALREGIALPTAERRAWRELDRGAQLRRSIVWLVVGVLALLLVVALASAVGTLLALAIAAVAAVLIAVRARIARAMRGAMRALAGAIGRLVSWRGITGVLARDNAMRQPGRTAITAAALMVGIGLVSFVSIFAAGTKAAIDRAVDRSFAGNLIVQNTQPQGGIGIPSVVAPALRRVPGVSSVTALALTKAKMRGVSGNVSVTAIDPASFARAYRITWQQGSDATLKQLGSTGVVVNKSFASSHHLSVGQPISVLTPTDRRLRLIVRGVINDNSRLLDNLTVTRGLARTAFGQRDDTVDFVSYAPGVSDAQVKPIIDQGLARYFPQAKAQTAAEFKAEQAKQVNTILGLIYVLLALSVIVSLLGIVNTLVLAIFERTRELGMLRAIGTSRRQVRQMIRYESIITALMGGVLGVALGLVGSIILDQFIGTGIFVLTIPIGTLIILLILAALAGVISAAWPARRAARLDPLLALAYE